MEVGWRTMVPMTEVIEVRLVQRKDQACKDQRE